MEDEKGNKSPSKDELFLHDVTGHLHGLSLFLNHCIQGKKRPSLHDYRHLMEEVSILQCLIKSHFNCHKTFFSTDEKRIKERVRGMIKNFFPEHEKLCVIRFYGKWKTLNYPAFFRIVGNLVKNTSESAIGEVEFIFEAKEKGLFFVIKNKFEKRGSRGLGLFSIEELCRSVGGDFCFSTRNGYWINEGWLPWEESAQAA